MASALAMQAKPLSLPTEQSRRRSGLRPGDSEHLHPALGAEHPLPIGGQDQGLIAGHVVRLSRDVPRAIEEEHTRRSSPAAPRKCTEMIRIGQMRLRGVAAMAELANDTAVKPRRRQRRARGAKRSAATCVSPCAAFKPGQAG